MAEITDPETPPIRFEVRSEFSPWAIALCVLLGGGGTLAGLLFGIFLANN